jgi:ribonuclease HII
MIRSQISQSNEEALWRQGIEWIAGIDEAGRGPLAGPVVAAAVIFPKNASPINGIDDSKKLTARKRENLAEQICQTAAAYGIGIVESWEIDAINILRATHKAMRKALGNLKMRPNYLLVDGRGLPDRIYPQKAIIRGDQVCYSVAAASILAKVIRDRLMVEYEEVFPGYGFKQHKGYGTKQHRDAIIQLGPSPIHRKSFSGVKEHLIDFYQSINPKALGKYGEDLAALYLFHKGYHVLERNFRVGSFGELDIIALYGDQLRFVEVKTQSHSVFGNPEEWVNERKQKQIALIAEAFLAQHPELDVECHFDVIGIKILNQRTRLRYLKDAFGL